MPIPVIAEPQSSHPQGQEDSIYCGLFSGGWGFLYITCLGHSRHCKMLMLIMLNFLKTIPCCGGWIMFPKRCPHCNPWNLRTCYFPWERDFPDVIKSKILRWGHCSRLSRWPGVITWGFMRGRQGEISVSREAQVCMMWERATSQGEQVSSRSWKR